MVKPEGEANLWQHKYKYHLGPPSTKTTPIFAMFLWGNLTTPDVHFCRFFYQVAYFSYVSGRVDGRPRWGRLSCRRLVKATINLRRLPPLFSKTV